MSVRTIKKRLQPTKLTQWRLPRMLANRSPGSECDYDSLRQFPEVIEAVEEGLFVEQSGICAYTGHQITLTSSVQDDRDVNFHIEHLTPRKHCIYGQKADYLNLVACWPRPNCGFEPAYGAKKKDNWPPPEEKDFFVSPLRSDCSSRFSFSQRGQIIVLGNNDVAARTTVEKLGLNHHTLVALRQNAIRGALSFGSRQIKLTEARKLLAEIQSAESQLNAGSSARLRPFCFAVKPALEREIRKLEGIMSRSVSEGTN